MANTIRLKLVTTLVKQSEGVYRTVAQLSFQDRGYEEGDICGYDPAGVIVKAKVSPYVLTTILNQQRGDEQRGNDPLEVGVVDGSIFDDETGQPIDPTSV